MSQWITENYDFQLSSFFFLWDNYKTHLFWKRRWLWEGHLFYNWAKKQGAKSTSRLCVSYWGFPSSKLVPHYWPDFVDILGVTDCSEFSWVAVIFFMATHMVLCFVFVTEAVWITNKCFYWTVHSIKAFSVSYSTHSTLSLWVVLGWANA